MTSLALPHDRWRRGQVLWTFHRRGDKDLMCQMTYFCSYHLWTYEVCYIYLQLCAKKKLYFTNCPFYVKTIPSSIWHFVPWKKGLIVSPIYASHNFIKIFGNSESQPPGAPLFLSLGFLSSLFCPNKDIWQSCHSRCARIGNIQQDGMICLHPIYASYVIAMLDIVFNYLLLFFLTSIKTQCIFNLERFFQGRIPRENLPPSVLLLVMNNGCYVTAPVSMWLIHSHSKK